MLMRSDLSVGSPNFSKATTGLENCTCIEGYFTIEGSSPSGVKVRTVNSLFSSLCSPPRVNKSADFFLQPTNNNPMHNNAVPNFKNVLRIVRA